MFTPPPLHEDGVLVSPKRWSFFSGGMDEPLRLAFLRSRNEISHPGAVSSPVDVCGDDVGEITTLDSVEQTRTEQTAHAGKNLTSRQWFTAHRRFP